MALQKMQMRKLAEIGAFTLRWYAGMQDADKKVPLKFEEVDEQIRRSLNEDQLEFEYEVTNEKVKIK